MVTYPANYGYVRPSLSAPFLQGAHLPTRQVLAVASSTGLLSQWNSFLVMGARKAANVKYPALYASNELAEKDPKANVRVSKWGRRRPNFGRLARFGKIADPLPVCRSSTGEKGS